jgi:hypothetical protein
LVEISEDRRWPARRGRFPQSRPRKERGILVERVRPPLCSAHSILRLQIEVQPKSGLAGSLAVSPMPPNPSRHVSRRTNGLIVRGRECIRDTIGHSIRAINCHEGASGAIATCLRTAEVAVPKELFEQKCNLDQLAGAMLTFSNVSHRSSGHAECRLRPSSVQPLKVSEWLKSLKGRFQFFSAPRSSAASLCLRFLHGCRGLS